MAWVAISYLLTKRGIPISRRLFRRRSALGLRACFFLLLSLALMMLDHRVDYFVQLRSALAAVVAPIQYAVDWPIKSVVWVKTAVTSQEALLKENARLQAERILLQAELQKILALEQENDELRALLQSTPKISGEVVAAQLLAVDSAPFSHQIVLGKGSRDGVYIGQPVFDANGVVGQVIEVGPVTSRVLMITDTRSGIPVQVYRNGVRGIVQGTGSISYLSLVNIPVTEDIRVGDTLVTSGLAGRFPEGYPVGTVVARIDQPGEEFATIRIMPIAGLNRARLLLLVWPAMVDEELTESLAEELLEEGSDDS